MTSRVERLEVSGRVDRRARSDFDSDFKASKKRCGWFLVLNLVKTNTPIQKKRSAFSKASSVHALKEKVKKHVYISENN